MKPIRNVLTAAWLRRRFVQPLSLLNASALLAAGLLGLEATAAAPPSLQLLPQGPWPAWQGLWPRWSRGTGTDVKVVGNRAYLTLSEGGLVVLDVSNPSDPMQVGSINTSGYADGVAVSGNYAYVVSGRKLVFLEKHGSSRR